MPTRNVVLTTHHESIIETLVNSGRYQNASEVLREGLRLIEARETLEAAKLQALKQAAFLGFSDLDHGRYTDVEDNGLEGFIEGLGRRAADRARAAGQ
jgi:antitoxin ParD1/3/4